MTKDEIQETFRKLGLDREDARRRLLEHVAPEDLVAPFTTPTQVVEVQISSVTEASNG